MSLNPLVRLIMASALAALFILPESIIAQAQVEAQLQPAPTRQSQIQPQQTPAEPAQTHLVSPADLSRATLDASRRQQQNLDTLNNFFSSDQARQALTRAHMDPEQVKTAIASLSPAEQAQLAARVDRAQADFAAGMSNNDLLIVLVLLAALILIIVAVR